MAKKSLLGRKVDALNVKLADTERRLGNAHAHNERLANLSISQSRELIEAASLLRMAADHFDARGASDTARHYRKEASRLDPSGPLAAQAAATVADATREAR